MKMISHGDDIRPVYMAGNSVVCVFEISEQYVPVYDVFLKSFLRNISPAHNYDIIILSSDIILTSEKQITEQINNTQNVSIRFFNPTNFVRDQISKSKHKYLDLNYYRLALPWMLKRYDKVLNLGVDMIVMRDVYYLYNTAMDNDALLAGVRDLDYVGRLNIDIPPSELDLSTPENYINADVLLYNTKRIRECCKMDDIFNLWDHYLFRLAEQDVLNMYFEGHILLLDGRWNVFPKRMLSDERIKKADIHFQEEWENYLVEPYIVHFAGTPKPWDNPEIGYGEIWWKYAMESCFYSRFIHKMAISVLGQKRPLLNKIIDTVLPKESRLGSVVKESVAWTKLRRIYHLIMRDPDLQKFGKRGVVHGKNR